ncbi:MAG: MFS transporter [Phycisphaerales bacterium]|nr:MFS transporter [Phycisphaerales bacterium]
MFYGWVILVISALAIFATSPGQSYLVGKFNESIGLELGMDAASISLAYGIATAIAAIPLLYVGRLSDRFGPRVIMGASAAALGLACWLIGFANGPVTLGLCYFLLRFSGQGALGLSASHSVAMWFERRLGTANGIKSLAMPAAIFVLPGLTTWLIASWGWKTAYGLLGVGVWIAVIPAVLLLHRSRPEDIGQHVDGVAPTGTPHPHPHAHPDAELIAALATEQPGPVDLVDDPVDSGEPAFTRLQAMATRAYWLVTIAMVANALIGTAFVFFLGSFAVDVGLAEGSEDRLLMLFAVVSALASPVAGLMTDRVAPRWLITSSTTLLGASCLCFAAAVLLPALAWVAMVTLALSQTLIFICGSTLFARFFGRPHHGAIRASLTFFMVTGTSLGPFLTSTIAARTGYGEALFWLGIACVPVALAGMALQPPRFPDA